MGEIGFVAFPTCSDFRVHTSVREGKVCWRNAKTAFVVEGEWWWSADRHINQPSHSLTQRREMFSQTNHRQ
eukprot:scaffold423_cov185-Ochromonas_danica.AAC.8